MSTIAMPLKDAERLLCAINAARGYWHQPDSSARTKAFLDLAWESGVLTYYVRDTRDREPKEVEHSAPACDDSRSRNLRG